MKADLIVARAFEETVVCNRKCIRIMPNTVEALKSPLVYRPAA
jgi:hypothetical protein